MSNDEEETTQPPAPQLQSQEIITQQKQPGGANELQSEVAAAAKALDAVAAAGGQARLEINKNGGTSIVIQVNNNNKDKVAEAQNAIKTLTSNTALKAANAKEELLRRERLAKREKNMTNLMKAARDDKKGKLVKKEIKALKSIGEVRERLLNEKEAEIDDEEEKKEEEKSSDKKEDDGTIAPIEGKAADGRTILKVGGSLPPKEGGFAAIHFACDSGNHEGLRFLLEAGADPNLTERMGATPLHRVILGAGKYPLAKLREAAKAGKNNENNSKLLQDSPPAMASPYSGKKKNTNDYSKMALPGVVGKDKGGGLAGIGIDNTYLEHYKSCLKLLLDNVRFDLMTNERRDNECRDSKEQTPSLDTMSVNEKRNVGKDGFPKDDGHGVSPLCLCVSQGYTGRDALYPLLEHLLTRGFDPIATMCGLSALHIALRNAHYGCAFALTRAGMSAYYHLFHLHKLCNAHLPGANINAVHPDGKTCLKAAELIYGESFARELREASVVAMAVADPKRRRDLLRSQGEVGAKKLAKRAMNAGSSFIKASRWREAAGAYSEAAAYGDTALPMRERFECLRNMSECFLQVERGLKSEEVARQLLKEFPDVPLAMIAVGEAMSHPSCGKLSPQQLKEVDKLANDALKAEKFSDNKEWWRKLEGNRSSNSSLIRALKLKGLVEGRSKEQNPAVKVANTALDEYFTPGGSIEKAAFAIELALKPELNHPSPLPLHGIRGFVYYSWASEILRANSSCRLDRERKDGLLRVMAPLKDKMSYKEARQKVEVASEEFQYYSKMNVNGEFPKLMYGFNISKTSFALGRFEEGRQSALLSIKERAEADLERLDDNGSKRKSNDDSDHFEGGSTQKLILQLNWALDMNRMMITQMVLDYAINADSPDAKLPDMVLEQSVEGLNLKDDIINMPHLKLVLEKAVRYKLIGKEYEKKLLEDISGNPVKVNAAITGLLSAMKTLEAGHQAMADLRVEVGKVIMDFISGAHRMQKRDKSSSRVVGSLLMEAFEWDKKVEIPKDLPKNYIKMAKEFSLGS